MRAAVKNSNVMVQRSTMCLMKPLLISRGISHTVNPKTSTDFRASTRSPQCGCQLSRVETPIRLPLQMEVLYSHGVLTILDNLVLVMQALKTSCIPSSSKGWLASTSQGLRGGDTHSLFLAVSGRVYSVGQGAFGALGHGDLNDLTVPKAVHFLWTLGCTTIACGSLHSAVSTSIGQVFCWGSNKYGQLGIVRAGQSNDDTPRTSTPSRVVNVSDVIRVRCGDCFTVCVSSVGDVICFGQGGHGQMANSASSDVRVARRVARLPTSATISSVACGASFCIATGTWTGEAKHEGGETASLQSPSTSVALLGWGAGESGQIGDGDVRDKMIPVPVVLRTKDKGGSADVEMPDVSNAGGDINTNTDAERPIVHVAAGGRHVLVSVTDSKTPCCRPAVFQLNAEYVNRIAKGEVSKHLPPLVEQVFSSASAISVSFGRPPPYYFDGIGLEATYKAILSTFDEHVITALDVAVQLLCRTAVSRLKCGADLEGLLVVLAVFQNPLMSKRVELLRRVAALVANAHPTFGKAVVQVWRHFPGELLVSRVLRPLQSIINTELAKDTFHMSDIGPSMQVLALVHQSTQREDAPPAVPAAEFHNDAVATRVNLAEDYVHWRQHGGIAFCAFPFLLRPDAKVAVLHADSSMRMQQVVIEGLFETFFEQFGPGRRSHHSSSSMPWMRQKALRHGGGGASRGMGTPRRVGGSGVGVHSGTDAGADGASAGAGAGAGAGVGGASAVGAGGAGVGGGGSALADEASAGASAGSRISRSAVPSNVVTDEHESEAIQLDIASPAPQALTPNPNRESADESLPDVASRNVAQAAEGVGQAVTAIGASFMAGMMAGTDAIAGAANTVVHAIDGMVDAMTGNEDRGQVAGSTSPGSSSNAAVPQQTAPAPAQGTSANDETRTHTAATGGESTPCTPMVEFSTPACAASEASPENRSISVSMAASGGAGGDGGNEEIGGSGNGNGNDDANGDGTPVSRATSVTSDSSWTPLDLTRIDGNPTHCVIKVRREWLLQDAVHAIGRKSISELFRPIHVIFVGEEGIDAGGVRKEFFQLLVDIIFNPDFGVFTYDDETRMYWFNHEFNSVESEHELELVGVITGLAIYNSVLLDAHLPLALYKKLKGMKVGLEDLIASSPDLGNGLKTLLEFTGPGAVEDVFCATFAVTYNHFGQTYNHDLIPNGSEIAVTEANRHEYVERYVDWYLNESIAPMFNSWSKGFLMMCQGPALELFGPEEIDVLICGQAQLDFAALRENATYDAGYSADSPVVQWFWDVVASMTQEERRQLLAFATGSSRAPVGGLGRLRFVIQRDGVDSNRLPTSHTCFNILLLPEYATQAKLKERLLAAITHTRGFGLE